MTPPDQPAGQPSGQKAQASRIQAPKGTRDLYPQDLLRKRYIEKAWRDTSIRHGFEEIDGPTFEYSDLYAVKSGEGILNEVFGVFSGKDEEQRAGGGRAPYALRPEFTPTLARMYAAKAGSLPKPTKWFWQQNCFRAERPQRGRLREFGQWNVDLIGLRGEPKSAEEFATARVDADIDVLSCCVALLSQLGLSPKDVVIGYSNRVYIDGILRGTFGLTDTQIAEAHTLLDQSSKLEPTEFDRRALELGIKSDQIDYFSMFAGARPLQGRDRWTYSDSSELTAFRSGLEALGLTEWCDFRPGIVRGLAYYTGMVFEVHEASGAERAIAGGGRYDGLIELFGGPSTPAVGFGMGDVVLSLVLQDRGLMPEGKALLDKLSAPSASLRPDVFVLSNGQPEAEAQVRPLVASLRRGETPLHARHSYKTTKNIGKLLQDAAAAHARFAAIIENASEATLKNLDTGTQERVGLIDIVARVKPARS